MSFHNIFVWWRGGGSFGNTLPIFTQCRIWLFKSKSEDNLLVIRARTNISDFLQITLMIFIIFCTNLRIPNKLSSRPKQNPKLGRETEVSFECLVFLELHSLLLNYMDELGGLMKLLKLLIYIGFTYYFNQTLESEFKKRINLNLKIQTLILLKKEEFAVQITFPFSNIQLCI